MAAQMPGLIVNLAEVWRPYDKQARFIESRALFQLFLAGVGAGKTHALTRWAIMRALANSNPDRRADTGQGALLGRTGVDLASVLLPSLEQGLHDLQAQTGIAWIADHNRGKGYYELINGARIWYRPYNRIAKIRGLTLTWCAADEIAYSEANEDEIWTVLTGRLRGHGPRPGIAFATSPNGYRGITKRFVDAQRRYHEAAITADAAGMREAGQYYVVTATSLDNPYTPAHYREALLTMKRSARRYKQEVLGKVLKPLNAVFEVERSRHIVEWDWQANLAATKQVFCVDWGSGRHNVALHVQVEQSGRWVVCGELLDDESPRGRFADRVVSWIRERCPNGDPALIAADRACPTENNLLQRAFGRTPVMGAKSRSDQDITTGIEMIRDLLDPVTGVPELVFASNLSQLSPDGGTAPLLAGMLGGYRYLLDLATGEPGTQPHKDNIHDHAVDALRYGVRMSANLPELHGGRLLTLPEVAADRRPKE